MEMSKIVDLAHFRELAARGAQVVEVLPIDDYEEMHIPGAVSHPLKELDAARPEQLDRGRPVVVYCWDWLCDLSPRAAAWLGQLGFDTYDYAVGKVDWLANGLPIEGSAAQEPTALSFVRDDVVRCQLDDHLDELSGRIEASPHRFALVLAGGVLLGRVCSSRAGDAPAGAVAKDVMEPGPSTMRPHRKPPEVERWLRSAGANTGILTSPGGVLIGVVRREDMRDGVQ
jgi:rhodanese-related sulfurtransferase